MNQQQAMALAAAANAKARNMVLKSALPSMQQVFQTSIATPGSGSNVVNVQPRYVGLIRGFLVKVTGTLTNNNSGGGGAATTLTALGASNFLSNISFYDFSNNLRHNTSGWHLALVNSSKRNQVFGAANTLNGFPVDFGNNYTNMITAPASIASTASGTVTMYYYVPLAYSGSDLRGAIFANVVNATLSLQLTINPTPSVASGDDTLSMYSGNGGALSNVTVTVFQDYLDQLPVAGADPELHNMGMSSGGYILPMADLNRAYMLQDTTFTGMAVSQDFPMPYANYRFFYSTWAMFNNGGTLNAGTDINTWGLQAANFTNIKKMDPNTWALITRNRLRVDPPAGLYLFDHRERPLSSSQYGNLELVLNASTVNSGAQVNVGYEMMARQEIVTGAGSLPGG